jgi:hypothetical protein
VIAPAAVATTAAPSATTTLATLPRYDEDNGEALSPPLEQTAPHGAPITLASDKSWRPAAGEVGDAGRVERRVPASGPQERENERSDLDSDTQSWRNIVKS